MGSGSICTRSRMGLVLDLVVGCLVKTLGVFVEGFFSFFFFGVGFVAEAM